MPVNSKAKGAWFRCEFCGGEFFVPQYEINCRKTIKYCSQMCYHASARKPEVKRKCLQCGKDFIVNPKHKNKKFCNTGCACAHKRAKERIPTDGADGYRYVWFADGSGEKEHRYVMERKIGRKLTRDEVVHHIDGNRKNNAIENLVIMSRGEHSTLHRMMELEEGKELFGGVKYANQ